MRRTLLFGEPLPCRNCSAAPDLALSKLNPQRVFVSGDAFQTLVPVSVKKHSSGEEETWDIYFEKHRIRGWIAASSRPKVRCNAARHIFTTALVPSPAPSWKPRRCARPAFLAGAAAASSARAAWSGSRYFEPASSLQPATLLAIPGGRRLPGPQPEALPGLLSPRRGGCQEGRRGGGESRSRSSDRASGWKGRRLRSRPKQTGSRPSTPAKPSSGPSGPRIWTVR